MKANGTDRSTTSSSSGPEDMYAEEIKLNIASLK